MFSKLKLIFQTFSPKERLGFIIIGTILVLTSASRITLAISENSVFVPIAGGIYKEGEIGQPIAVNPLISPNTPDLDISALVYSNLADLLSTSEKSKDGRLYTLKLKENLRWDDNEPLTSDDVIFTIETVQNPDAKSPLFKSWQGIVAERVSELQVNLNLPTPYVFFDENLKRLPILPKHIFSNIPAANLALSTYNLEPVGSGPYSFKNFIKRKDGFITDYILTANANYVGSQPLIKDFYFKFYADEKDLLQALHLHQINGFGTPEPLPTAQEIGNLKEEKISMPRYYAIFMNQNVNPLLKNPTLRQALSEAIDKEKINQEVFGGEAQTINEPLFNLDQNQAPTSSAQVYNPDEAQKLIVGLKKNNPLALTIIIPQVDFLKKAAEIVKAEWLAAGIDQVDIQTREQNDLMDNVIKARNYELLLFGNVLENPLDLFPFWHSSGRFYPGLNLALYQNSKVDNYLETIRETDDLNRQKNLLTSAINLINTDEPAIFLFSLPYTYLHTINLNGFALSDNTQFLITPADRFQNVNQWSVTKARILKPN